MLGRRKARKQWRSLLPAAAAVVAPALVQLHRVVVEAGPPPQRPSVVRHAVPPTGEQPKIAERRARSIVAFDVTAPPLPGWVRWQALPPTGEQPKLIERLVRSIVAIDVTAPPLRGAVGRQAIPPTGEQPNVVPRRQAATTVAGLLAGGVRRARWLGTEAAVVSVHVVRRGTVVASWPPATSDVRRARWLGIEAIVGDVSVQVVQRDVVLAPTPHIRRFGALPRGRQLLRENGPGIPVARRARHSTPIDPLPFAGRVDRGFGEAADIIPEGGLFRRPVVLQRHPEPTSGRTFRTAYPFAVVFVFQEPVEIGGGTWLVTWESTDPGPFYVWVDGVLRLTTHQRRAFIYGLEDDEPITLDVFTSAADTPATVKPARAEFTWEPSDVDTECYRIEKFNGSVWKRVWVLPHDPAVTTYRWRTDTLADDTTHQFRVMAIDVDGNESSTTALTMNMIREPDPPNVTIVLNDGPATLTISDAGT